MVNKKLGVKIAKELERRHGLRAASTTTELNLADYFPRQQMTSSRCYREGRGSALRFLLGSL